MINRPKWSVKENERRFLTVHFYEFLLGENNRSIWAQEFARTPALVTVHLGERPLLGPPTSMTVDFNDRPFKDRPL